EYLDLVDENDVVIGRKLRSEAYAEGLRNFRVINAFVVNAKGELWIPRRSATKATMPLCLDTSVGGHVESGETYDQAFRRETKEEINIDIEHVSWRVLGCIAPREHPGLFAYMTVYEIQSDETPELNPDEFAESFWMKPADLLARIEAGDKVKSDLTILTKYFYSERP
ncbi:MAG: NUDIX domain-containing protein, partial [Patescibacteria group bacterium]